MRRKWAVLGSRPLPGVGRGVPVLPVRSGPMAEAQASSNASAGQAGALDLWICSVRRMGPLRNCWHDAGCVASPEILHSFVESHSRKRFPPDDKCPRGSLQQWSSRGGRFLPAPGGNTALTNSSERCRSLVPGCDPSGIRRIEESGELVFSPDSVFFCFPEDSS